MREGALMSGWRRLLERRPDKPVLYDAASGRSFSPRALDTMAAKSVPGIHPSATGRVIALRLPNGPRWIAAFIAIIRSGGIAMPLDYALSPAQAVRFARDAGCAFLVQEGASDALVRFANPARLDPGLRVGKTTSGTTGAPKAVFFRESEIAADGRNVIAAMGIRETDTSFGHIPFGHSYGIGNLIAPMLLQGTAVVAAREPIPRLIWRQIVDSRATILPTVPDVIRALGALDLPDAAALRLVISAGARLDPEVARQFAARRRLSVHNFFGSSETGAIAYDRKGDASLSGKWIGHAVDGVHLTLGRGGRLRVTSRAVYTHRNRRRSGGSGSFLLPDRAELGRDGAVRLIGRAGRAMKIGGRRVDLAAFEHRCREHDSIEACVAVPLEADRRFGALFVLREPVGSLQEWLRATFPRWMVPGRVRVVTKLPIDARGKTSIAEVRRLLEKQ